MGNNYFQFKQFKVTQEHAAMKVTTDSCLFGAWAAKEALDSGSGKHAVNLLDIGTGTGLLSLMVSQKIPVHIDAVEIEPGAASEAKANIDASPWAHTIHLHAADIISFENEKQYDIILSNPPFYENE